MSEAVEALKLIWPDGIPVTDYELATELGQKFVTRKRVGVFPVPGNPPPRAIKLPDRELPADDETITTIEAAKRLGVTVSTVCAAIARGAISAEKVRRKGTKGPKFAVSASSVEKYAETRRKS